MRRKTQSSTVLGRGSACLSCRWVSSHILSLPPANITYRRRKLVSSLLSPSYPSTSTDLNNRNALAHVQFVPNAVRWSEPMNANTTIAQRRAGLNSYARNLPFSRLNYGIWRTDHTRHREWVLCPSAMATVRLLTTENQLLTYQLKCTMLCTLSILYIYYSKLIPKSIQTFIMHRRQCCFYTNTSRFDSLSSATIFQCSPPNPSLMSAIYLLGSFFSDIPLPHELQTPLLEQALRNLTRSLHNQEQLIDAVQASCLIAQYFFFNRRVIEGNRHLLAAKRMAFDLGLYSISEPDVSSYAYDSGLQDTMEKSVVFWQVFMVDRFWSVTNHCDVTLPDRSPYRYSTTPLPVKEGVRLVSWKQKVHIRI